MTMPQLMSAKKKIGQVAAFFDPLKHSFSGFDSVALDPTQFREQLRRNFLIHLTDAELGAVVFLFDKDGDGFVDSVEFINEFFRLGKQEKASFTQNKVEKEEKIAKRRKKFQEERKKRLQKLADIATTTTWTDDEERNAIKKIAKVAFCYDAMKGGLEGFFVCASLTEPQFREQLRRNFEINLTPAESAALMKIFDSDGNGEISCKEFMYHFFRIGRNEKDIHFKRQKDATELLLEKEQKRVETVKQYFANLTITSLKPATKEETKLASDKIKMAALYYKGGGAFGDIKKSFESSSLTPTAFRELLKRNFDITLSAGELDAMLKMFDDNGDGFVSCSEFLSYFFRIGQEERSRLLKKKVETEKLMVDEKIMRDRMLLEKGVNKLKTRVIWPTLPMDDDVGTYDGASMTSSTRISTPSVFTTNLKKAPRPTMSQILSPNKEGSLLKSQSLVELFPKASKETKDFLCLIEEQEKRIKSMKLPKFNMNESKTQGGLFYSTEYSGSLEDREWANGDDGAHDNAYRALTSTTNASQSNSILSSLQDGRCSTASSKSSRSSSKAAVVRPNTVQNSRVKSNELEFDSIDEVIEEVM